LLRVSGSYDLNLCEFAGISIPENGDPTFLPLLQVGGINSSVYEHL